MTQATSHAPVRFIDGPGCCNIVFQRAMPMCGGKFPASHPCHDDPSPMAMGSYRTKAAGDTEWTNVPGEMPVSDTPLGRFRARGYWASCFPEGEGIVIEKLNGQSTELVVRDFTECFGIEVVEVQRQ